MALGAVLGAALNTGAAHPWTLTVQGLDVIRDPAGAYGTPLDTVSLTMAALGGVSSLEFTIEVPDSSTLVGVNVADWVYLTRNPGSIIFAGFVQTVSRVPMGPSGVRITVAAQGVETILDWSPVTSTVVFPAFADHAACVQRLVGVTQWGAPGVKAFLAPTYSVTGAGLGNVGTLVVGCTVNAGTTLRAALRQLSAACGTPGRDILATIDPNMDLRTIVATLHEDGSSEVQSDLGTLTLTKGYGSPAPGDISTAVDGGQAVQSTYVVGSGVTAASSTGLPGPVQWVSDAGITTDAGARARIDAEFVAGRVLSRGKATVETTAGPAAFPGSQLLLLDAVTLVAGGWYVVGDVDVKFYDTFTDTIITFGSARPSLADTQ